MGDQKSVLEMKGILKDYPGVRAVNYANLELAPGEVHALVGENGAGKSTLIKILAGVVHPDEGEIYLNGELVEFRSGEDAYHNGLSFIHQELNLIPYLNGAENVFLGHDYPKTWIGMVNWPELYRKANAVLARLGVSVPLNVPVSYLSAGDQSMIAIARAFAIDASIIVMDEPTASLSDHEIRNLFDVIRNLKSQGRTILYISHRLEELFEITDRVTVMRDGSVVGTYQTAAIDQAELIHQMIGRELTETVSPRTSEIGQVVLEMRNVSSDSVRDVNFQVRAGEILGVAGLVGSGRTELLSILFGKEKVRAGEVLLDGKPFQPKSPADAICQKIALVPEERHTQGLVMRRTIVENMTLPHLASISTGRVFLNPKREASMSKNAGESVKLKAASLENPVSSLSGGNQQKVVFARWLLKDTRVLLLDEPTRGVDVGARFEIYRIIRELSAMGAAILVVSSDLPELLGLADRLVILRDGRMVDELNDMKNITQEIVLSHCYGEE